MKIILNKLADTKRGSRCPSHVSRGHEPQIWLPEAYLKLCLNEFAQVLNVSHKEKQWRETCGRRTVRKGVIFFFNAVRRKKQWKGDYCCWLLCLRLLWFHEGRFLNSCVWVFFVVFVYMHKDYLVHRNWMIFCCCWKAYTSVKSLLFF